MSEDRGDAARQPGTALPPEVNVVAVGSGKGGVGKSIMSVLLAASLAARGRRVLLLDGDQQLGNLHVLLGVRAATRVEALLSNSVAAADLLRLVAPNLWLLPGASGAETLYGFQPLDRARLQHRFSAFYDGFDSVIVDAGSGIEGVMRVATIRATRLLVVTAPEPTALTDAYALIKIATLRIPHVPIDVLVNRCLTSDEGFQAYTKLAIAGERLLRRDISYLGAIPEDRAVRAAVQDPGCFLATIQRSEAAAAIDEAMLNGLDLPGLTAAR